MLNDQGTLLGDSFEIAQYLETTYKDTPSLFDGDGGLQLSRFVESYCKTVLHPTLAVIAVMDMYNIMSDADRAYFRNAREKRFGKSLEDVYANRDAELATLPEKLNSSARSARNTRLAWRGESHACRLCFVRYAAMVLRLLYRTIFRCNRSVQMWFERMLDLHGGVGRKAVSEAIAA